MNITQADIEPFVDDPIPPASAAIVQTWLTAINARLGVTFGPVLPDNIAPAVFDIVAIAVGRRLNRRGADPRVQAQTTGPSSVTYNTDVTMLTGWFYPTEIDDLARLFGVGGNISSIRTPAPDAVRYGNLAGDEWDDEDDGW